MMQMAVDVVPGQAGCKRRQRSTTRSATCASVSSRMLPSALPARMVTAGGLPSSRSGDDAYTMHTSFA
jgi:hypothetical protein